MLDKVLYYLSQASMVISENVLEIQSKITGSKVVYREFENNFLDPGIHHNVRELILKLRHRLGYGFKIEKASDDLDLYFMNIVSLKNTFNLDPEFLDDSITYVIKSIENGRLANRDPSLKRMLDHIYEKMELGGYINKNEFIDKVISDLDKIRVGHPLLKIFAIGAGIGGVMGALGKIAYNYYKSKKR